MPTKSKWTFMSYMAGDNNLSSLIDDNLEEMQKVGSTPTVNVVGQFDKDGDNDTRRFIVKKNERKEIELKETDCCDPAVLKKFIDWAVKRYPADHYALVLYGHGWGWEPSKADPQVGKQLFRMVREPGAIRVRERGAVRDGKTNRSGHVRTRKKHRAITRSFGPDDRTGHALDTIEMRKVIAHAHKKIGKKLDILGLDGCLMSNLEVAYEIKDYATYLIASEQKAPPGAWPYDRVLNVFNDKTKNSPTKIPSELVNEYINSYKDQENDVDATQSAFSLEKIEGMAKSVEALGEALLVNMPSAKKAITTALNRSKAKGFKSFFSDRLWDINEIAMEISKTTNDPKIKQAAIEVQARIKPGPKKFVLSKSETGPGFDTTWGGLSVYLFSPGKEEVSEFYEDLKFTESHPNWHKMLQSISKQG